MPGRLPTGGTCWDDLGDYVKKTAAAHHGCIKDHYAVLEQTAAEQAPDPQQAAGQATAEHAGNRARVIRTLSGLMLPYSSGAVEGKVGKIKFWKRLVFGRANLDLLRKMALWN